MKAHSSTLVSAKIKFWKPNFQFPVGSFVKILGSAEDFEIQSKALLIDGGVTWDDFSGEVLSCLESTPRTILDEEYQKRLDIRNECVFSIDPPTARDLDDAISIKELGDNTYEIGVHIADVSYFVRPDTTLDSEAQHRSTSVYLVQKVIPMLPRLLCEELCSLNAGVDRLAFSVFWIFDENGNILGKPTFKRTIINSCAKLSYDHAQCVIDGRDWDSAGAVDLSGKWKKKEIESKILKFYNFSKILRAKRYDNGALSLFSIRLWFDLDESGFPISTGVYEQKEANRLIEEVSSYFK